MRQYDSESICTFFARIKEKAAICAYTKDCPQTTCNQSIDFTSIFVSDMLISGLPEDQIKGEVLGWAGLDASSMEETVLFLEAREIAREAINRHSSTNKKDGKKDLSK